MDPIQQAAIEAQIGTAVNTAGQIAEVIAPQYTVFIVLGMAVAKAIPGLVTDVENLISGTAPDPAANAAIAAKIAALANPDAL